MSKSIKFKNNVYLDNISVHKDIAIACYTCDRFYLNQEHVEKNFDNAKILGKKLSLKNGKIYIGKNVKRVRVNATIFLENVSESNISYIFVSIRKNGIRVVNNLISGSTYFDSVTITDNIIDVKENDYFSLEINNPNWTSHSAASVRGGVDNTRMYIEVVE